MIERLKSESGYSLVEAMASIMILAIAIIPMVAMFDAGLRAASTGSNYDTARTFANQQLELAKSLTYATVRDGFPSGTPAPDPSSGTITSSSQAVSRLPNGSYTVTKTYVSRELVDDGNNSDRGLLKIRVTVSWATSNSYTTTGVVAE